MSELKFLVKVAVKLIDVIAEEMVTEPKNVLKAINIHFHHKKKQKVNK